jgi:hypothetical protein
MSCCPEAFAIIRAHKAKASLDQTSDKMPLIGVWKLGKSGAGSARETGIVLATVLRVALICTTKWMEFGIQAKLVGSHVNMEADDRGWFSGTMSKPAFHAQILLNIEHLRFFFWEVQQQFMEPSTIRTNCSGLGVGSLVTTKGYGFKIARQSKTLLSEPVRVPRQHRCSQGVQMTATIKTLHTKCNRFWTVQGPKLLQKMRPARSQWLQIQWNCRKPSVSGQKLCIITVYMLFLFKIQHVVLLQLQLLGMCKWGSVITVAWSRARHGEQNTAADVLISIAPHSEKGAYLIRDFVSSRNYFLAICRLWQHGVGAWPRLGIRGANWLWCGAPPNFFSSVICTTSTQFWRNSTNNWTKEVRRCT